MTRWNKIKSLFVVEEGGKMDASSLAAAAQVNEAELLAMELPAGDAATLPASADSAKLAGRIDFQALYDEAGIPNTDEVEALEKFLAGLDDSLPQASKLAAAKAFLGAIGKSPADVLRDAGQKIRVTRAVDQAKAEWTEAELATHQQEIDALQKKIEEHRAAMEDLRKQLEDVRSQCTVEEARLQGARVFFGAMDRIEEGTTPGTPPAATGH